MPRNSWLRLAIDREALRHNAACFRRHLPAGHRLLVVVKADGYGHGMSVAAESFLAGGADVLGVHSVPEALHLRESGIMAPVLVLGPADRDEATLAGRVGVELTVASVDAISVAASAAEPSTPLRIHLKVETGVNRQGIVEVELPAALAALREATDLKLVGLSSHFADIEDTTDHHFALAQAERFRTWRGLLAEAGYDDLESHMSCSAAAILWPAAEPRLVRVGISAYGIWPSRETRVSAQAAGLDDLELRPALTLGVKVSQIRDVPAGETVGYGRTWQTPADRRIAVLPVGYADGYPRSLSDRAHVLLRGRRAPVVGRICMNMTMVDVTHIPEAAAGDEAVLLGSQGSEGVTAEQLADWLGTIAYEVLVLPRSTWTRDQEELS